MDDMVYSFLYIIIFAFIISYILKHVYKLSFYYAKMIFFVSLLVVLIPSLDSINQCYFQTFLCITIILVSYTIWISKFSLQIKIILILLLLVIYYKNIYLVLGIVSIAFNSMIIPGGDKLIRKKPIILAQKMGMRVLTNWEKLPQYPVILLANYCRDRTENAFCITIPKKIAIIMQKGFRKVNMNKIIDYPIYVNGHGKGNFENICEQIKIAVQKNISIFAYITTPSYYDYINRLKTGMIKIAIKQGIPIVPIAIDHIDTKFGIIPNQNFCIKVGDPIIDTNIISTKYKVSKFLRVTLKEFSQNKYNKAYKI